MNSRDVSNFPGIHPVPKSNRDPGNLTLVRIHTFRETHFLFLSNLHEYDHVDYFPFLFWNQMEFRLILITEGKLSNPIWKGTEISKTFIWSFLIKIMKTAILIFKVQENRWILTNFLRLYRKSILKFSKINHWKAVQYELTSPVFNMEQYIPLSLISVPYCRISD